MSGLLTKVRIDRRTDRPTLSFWREIDPAYYKGFEGNEANVSAGIDEFFDMQLIDWSILGFTCMKAFPQYQVISLDSTSQATHVETCCYVVWIKERNLYQWSTNRGRAAALVKFQTSIAVKNLEIFTVIITTCQNIYQAVNRIYSCSFSLQDMKVCSRTSTRMRWSMNFHIPFNYCSSPLLAQFST